MKRDAELRRAKNLLSQLSAIPDNERLLTDEQRLWLRTWRASCRSDINPEEAAACYAASLEAEFVDNHSIRHDIAKIINRNVPVIQETDTAEQAADKWTKYALLG